ncbi:fumarylacetoacetate hydrolase [Fusarium acutatum]|uniref:Fumarylacetoacetate hydrolase n=1 Tax=Fusarium acutatum TaxID=78861 RepID=A0A8H4JCM7_9HYPO|nr:fumarylacetoacetate hydrolase [Fusarium acutatum]
MAPAMIYSSFGLSWAFGAFRHEALQFAKPLRAGSPFSPTNQVGDSQHGIQKLLCPIDIDHARSVVCIGLNYTDHAEVAKMAIPKVPVVFFKPVTALTGPFDDLVLPVIVIGKKASRVSKDDALDYVFGYTAGNDISNRAWQLEPHLGGGQWCYSKCFDSSAPIGPAVVSKDILGSAVGLGIRGTLNDTQVQDGNTNNMIFSVAEIVSFLSQGMTLLPGTLIFTDTPAGVGFGRKPQISMKESDVTKVEIDGIGAIANKVVYENRFSENSV